MTIRIDPATGERIEDVTIDPATGERIVKAGHGATGNWGDSGPAPSLRPTPTLSQALLPSYSEASQGADNNIRGQITGEKQKGGVFRQALGIGSDAISGLLRIPAAAGRMVDTKMGWAGDHPQGFAESLDQINHGEAPDRKPSYLAGMEADPATLAAMAVGGPELKGGVSLVDKLARTALKGAEGGAVSAGLHQGDQMARTGKVNPGEAVAEVGINTVAPLALTGALAPVKGAVGGLKTILSKFSDIDPAALKAASNPEALAAARQVTRSTGGDLSNMADNLGQKTQQFGAEEQAAADAVNARRGQTLERGLLDARLGEKQAVAAGQAPSTLQDVSAFQGGKRIEAAAQNTRKAAGERFQQGQDAILVDRGVGNKGVEFGGVEGNQTPFEQTVDKYLADAGVGQGGKNYGVIGNVSIPAGAINEIRGLKDTFKSALTTRDMLDQLRLVDNKLNFGGPDGHRLFASGSQEDLAMKGLRARLSDDLENQIGRAAGKKDRAAVVSAWNAHREAYSKTADALEKIQEGLGAGNVNQESYFNRIKNIGVDDLRGIAAEAKRNPDLAPTWNELRKGFFDNIIASGIKDDGIEYAKIKKVWDTMDDDLKSTMLPTKVISHVDGVLDRTAPIDFKGSTLADNNRWMGRDRQSTLNSLENIGSKAKRTDLEDLKTLDDLLGLEGKDRFSNQAGSFYLGKQLGMTDKGALPLFTGSRTGAKLAGAAIGGGIGGTLGASEDGARGGSVGTSAGMLAGVALQSPAGALAAYKLLNKIRAGAVMSERKVIRPLGNHGLTSGRAVRSVTTPLFGGGSEE